MASSSISAPLVSSTVDFIDRKVRLRVATTVTTAIPAVQLSTAAGPGSSSMRVAESSGWI
jgi:hypothetical protein